ncbi:MAG: transposase [Acidobacteria bacterium]|nr:transposase [Acidobacteriota bacterium]MBS1867492.1 transposase [Acidobacteriota bacterium]
MLCYCTNVLFRRKNIRLPAQDYFGKRIYFVTICCDRRKRIFVEERIGRWLIKHLRRSSQKHNFIIHAYCIMPDHVHLLAEGKDESCNLSRFVSYLKQETGSAYAKRFGKQLWQTKYFDRVLRKAEDAESVAWYIWLNPFRKGLCQAPQNYPLSGSFTVDWKKRCAPARIWTPTWRARDASPFSEM